MKANNSDNCLENFCDTGALADKEAVTTIAVATVGLGALADKEAVTTIAVATVGLKE